VDPWRICDGSLTYSNLREMQIEWAQFSTIPPVNMDRIVVASADDVHIKYFHRRQSPTTADLPKPAVNAWDRL